MKGRLDLLEMEALNEGLLLRLQVRRPFNIWALKLVVAKKQVDNSIQILGEIKGWAYSGLNGFQLDTMRVHPKAPIGVGHLIWAGVMSWALENTPCKKARLLAIRDEDKQHATLIRYFISRGFIPIQEVGSSPFDLPLRLVWGGAGTLMIGDCEEVFKINQRRWQLSKIS